MKCLCGHKHNEHNHDTNEMESNGVKGFIKLKNCEVKVANSNFDGWHGNMDIRVEVYACPECGTLKIDV